jgi:hypothetical protein
LLVLSLAGHSAAAQTADPLAEIRALYNSAAYEEALTKLDGVEGAPARVEQYRAFCLLALGRREEALASVTKAVDADPMWMPAADDASPRVQTFYAEERRKLLPGIVRTAYESARAAYVTKNYADAVKGFTRVKELLATAGQDSAGLSDIALLAEDFLNLARAAAAPHTAAAPGAPPVTPPAAASASKPARPVGETRGPVVISQKLPTWTRTTWTGNLNGLLHIEIDETGAVTAATMVRQTQPQYDLQLLEAARSWRYQPAIINGRPVASTKDIGFTLKP